MAMKQIILDDSIMDFDSWLTPEIINEMAQLIFGEENSNEEEVKN